MIAGLGIGALAIGFAFQDIFENFLAGVLIMLREKMRIGDMIEVEGMLGKVEKITLRETYIRQLSNELTIMPNSMLFKNAVKILTDERCGATRWWSACPTTPTWKWPRKPSRKQWKRSMPW